MKLSHKMKVGIIAAISCLAIAGAAFAYFTTIGDGTGSGTVGTSSNLVLHGSTSPTLLYPGTSAVVNFTVDSTSDGQHIGTITLDSVDTGVVGCDSADFTMAPVDADQDIDIGDGIGIIETGMLEMANTPDSQDLCKDAVLELTLSST